MFCGVDWRGVVVEVEGGEHSEWRVGAGTVVEELNRVGKRVGWRMRGRGWVGVIELSV